MPTVSVNAKWTTGIGVVAIATLIAIVQYMNMSIRNIISTEADVALTKAQIYAQDLAKINFPNAFENKATQALQNEIATIRVDVRNIAAVVERFQRTTREVLPKTDEALHTMQELTTRIATLTDQVRDVERVLGMMADRARKTSGEPHEYPQTPWNTTRAPPDPAFQGHGRPSAYSQRDTDHRYLAPHRD